MKTLIMVTIKKLFFFFPVVCRRCFTECLCTRLPPGLSLTPKGSFVSDVGSEEPGDPQGNAGATGSRGAQAVSLREGRAWGHCLDTRGAPGD